MINPIERREHTMLKYTGGQQVGSGTYWDVMTGLRVDMDQEGMLPGGNGTRYMKASSGAIVLWGPILGLAYIVILPIMGIVTAFSLLLQKTLGGVFNLGQSIISFGWRPSVAYLGGKNKKKGTRDESIKAPLEK
jgi:hypothetical protein